MFRCKNKSEPFSLKEKVRIKFIHYYCGKSRKLNHASLHSLSV